MNKVSFLLTIAGGTLAVTAAVLLIHGIVPPFWALTALGAVSMAFLASLIVEV